MQGAEVKDAVEGGLACTAETALAVGANCPAGAACPAGASCEAVAARSATELGEEVEAAAAGSASFC